MQFNLDDPLADLLSDHSNDNDNFFDNGKRHPKVLHLQKNTKMEDLFGIKEEATTLRVPITRNQNASKGGATTTQGKQQSAATITPTPRITTQKPSLPLNDNGNGDDDVDLGFDPKKPKASGGAKINLFDDLLEAPKRPSTAKPAISRQSTDTTTDTNLTMTLSQAAQVMRPKTSTGRRGSGNSTAVNTDPLGLFSASTAVIKEKERDAGNLTSGMSTPKAKKRATTADWLGLSVEPPEPPVLNVVSDKEPLKRIQTPKDHNQDIAKPMHKENIEILKVHEREDDIAITPRTQMIIGDTLDSLKATPVQPTQNMLMFNALNLENQNAYAVMQQQESQLALAMQMKQQEQALMEMQRKQETFLKQQEKQFNALLQHQVHRQQQLEEHIKSQQQRINTHLQLMMTQQPSLMPLVESKQPVAEATPHEGEGKAAHVRSQQVAAVEIVQLEADVKRFELDKLRLEELVENIKSNYEKEIKMIENSFRKQLKVLEEHLAAVETRLKGEIEELHTSYGKKLETLSEEKQRLKSDYEADIATLKQDHDDELRRLRKSHEEDMDMVKEEQRRMLDTIRQAKVLEFAAVQENGSYLETLRAASNNLAGMSGDLLTLRDEMQIKMETINKEREMKLDARERRLEDAEKRLRLTEDFAEDEKRRLMTLVGTLEVQLNKQTKELSEENWLQRQKMATLEAEKLAFEREKTLTREQFARDEKRIEDLKEQQLAETQRQLLDIQEERSRLAMERAKIEAERQLQPSFDYDKQRLEVEAALKVAHDATRQADAERVRYHKMQRELEQQKREIIDKENMLRAKEEEVDQEIQSMRQAERKSLQTQHGAREAQQNFQTKILLLQRRMRELSEKETQLSQEQLLLSQQRMDLQNTQTKLVMRKCALCKLNERKQEVQQMLNVSSTSADGIVATSEDLPTRNADKYRHMLSQTNVVERMLDDNIAESYRRMRNTIGNADYWTDSVLDDDSKELALHNFDADLQLNNVDELNKDPTTNG